MSPACRARGLERIRATDAAHDARWRHRIDAHKAAGKRAIHKRTMLARVNHLAPAEKAPPSIDEEVAAYAWSLMSVRARRSWAASPPAERKAIMSKRIAAVRTAYMARRSARLDGALWVAAWNTLTPAQRKAWPGMSSKNRTRLKITALASARAARRAKRANDRLPALDRRHDTAMTPTERDAWKLMTEAERASTPSGARLTAQWNAERGKRIAARKQWRRAVSHALAARAAAARTAAPSTSPDQKTTPAPPPRTPAAKPAPAEPQKPDTKPPTQPTTQPTPPAQPTPAPTPPATAPATQATPATTGELVCKTSPVARVWIDGQDTGRTTPIESNRSIKLTPGRHIVTFVVSGQMFQFGVTIEAGKTTTLLEILPMKKPD
jgi:hypothetical protein